MMKYNENNRPLVCMQTNSTCYKETKTMNIKGVLWHSTGSNNPNLKRYVQPSENDPNYSQLLQLIGKNSNGNDWNHIERQAGLNCWIGKLANGEVTTVQTMPWNYMPMGCGSGKKGSCNNGWIQFEICEDSLADPIYFNKIYQEACEITAYLCKTFNINPLGTVNYNGVVVPTILCHQDSYKLGLGSGHSDVLHWFPKFGKNMDSVRNDVAMILAGTESKEEDENMTQETFNKLMDNYLKDLGKKPISDWAQADIVWAQQNGLIVGDETGNTMPRSFMTREALAAVLHRFENKFIKQ